MNRMHPRWAHALLVAAGLTASVAALAHNNPTFREDLLVKVEVPADGTSDTFSLTLPKGAVQLLFRVEPADAGASFSLQRDGAVVAGPLGHDGAANIANGDGFSLVAAAGAVEAYSVTVLVKVLDRSAAKNASQLALGRKTYQKANCVGCHKWHGGGGGGYGGAALSLRKTGLERAQLIEVVRCGRPGTGMPAHARGAYETVICFGGMTAEQLGNNMPPMARRTLRDEGVEAVIDYLLATLKGRGEPTKEECLEYWGEKSQACSRM